MTLSITQIRKAAEDPGAIQEWFAEKADRDVNESDFWGRTFLHYAVEKSQFEAMRYLLDRGADANAADEHGMTPLHFAARFGCPAAAALLLERGARVDQREGHDGTPLLLAVCFEDRDDPPPSPPRRGPGGARRVRTERVGLFQRLQQAQGGGAPLRDICRGRMAAVRPRPPTTPPVAPGPV